MTDSRQRVGDEQTSIICRSRCGGQTPSSTVHTQTQLDKTNENTDKKDNKPTDTDAGTQINTDKTGTIRRHY